MKIATMVFAAALLPAWAQEIKMPVNLDALAEKADNAVTVTLDKSMLQFASKFMHDKDDEDDVRKIISGLDQIYVRSFEFRDENEYNQADVEAVRSQLRSPAWGRMVGVRSKHGENVDVYFKDSGNGRVGGLVVIAAEPKELTIVNIIGNIDPDKIAELGGEFSIPRFERSRVSKGAK
jgi:hypothetical protein